MQCSITDSSQVVSQPPVNINGSSELKRRARDDGKEEKSGDSFVFLVPITPRAPFGHAARRMRYK